MKYKVKIYKKDTVDKILGNKGYYKVEEFPFELDAYLKIVNNLLSLTKFKYQIKGFQTDNKLIFDLIIKKKSYEFELDNRSNEYFDWKFIESLNNILEIIDKKGRRFGPIYPYGGYESGGINCIGYFNTKEKEELEVYGFTENSLNDDKIIQITNKDLRIENIDNNDLSFLKKIAFDFSKIHELRVSSCEFETLNGIEILVNLKKIFFHNSYNGNFEGLRQNMPIEEILIFDGVSGTLNGLPELNRLTSLNITQIENKNIELPKLKNLKYLKIGGKEEYYD